MSRCSRGFTLVELLVVIGIVALLISILMPALTKARQAALGTQCLSNQRQLGIAFNMYRNESRGFLPPLATPGAAKNKPGLWLWQFLPGRYLNENSKSYICPSDDLFRQDYLELGIMAYRGPYARMYSGIEDVYYSYALNADLPRRAANVYPGFQAGVYNPKVAGRIRSLADTAVLFEANNGGHISWGTWISAPHYYRFSHGNAKKKKMTILYADGHAGMLEVQDMTPGANVLDTTLWPPGFRSLFFGRADVDRPIEL